MASIPSSMKAWTVVRFGKPKDALQLKTEWPTRAPPKGDDILVKVSVVTLNPLDLDVMALPTFFKNNAVPAVDFAGQIVLTGPSVSSTAPDLRVGVTVCGTVPPIRLMRGSGTLAEYIVLPAHVVTEKPLGLESEAAATLLGVSGQTTASLMSAAEFAEGDKVLVNGASGGVGCIVVQVLPAKGAHITAICSGSNDAMVRRLGAEQVIDYTAHDSLYDHLSTRDVLFDTIIDLVGDVTLYNRSPKYLKPKGKFLHIDGLLPPIQAKVPVILRGTPRTFLHVNNSPFGAMAKEAAGWFKSGWIKEIPINSTYEMDDAMQLYLGL